MVSENMSQKCCEHVFSFNSPIISQYAQTVYNFINNFRSWDWVRTNYWSLWDRMYNVFRRGWRNIFECLWKARTLMQLAKSNVFVLFLYVSFILWCLLFRGVFYFVVSFVSLCLLLCCDLILLHFDFVVCFVLYFLGIFVMSFILCGAYCLCVSRVFVFFCF